MSSKYENLKDYDKAEPLDPLNMFQAKECIQQASDQELSAVMQRAYDVGRADATSERYDAAVSAAEQRGYDRGLHDGMAYPSVSRAVKAEEKVIQLEKMLAHANVRVDIAEKEVKQAEEVLKRLREMLNVAFK